MFDWWIALASAPKPLFMTFPFGIVADFRPVFDKDDGVLRFALLDKYVNGGTAASRAAAIADIERIRRLPMSAWRWATRSSSTGSTAGTAKATRSAST